MIRAISIIVWAIRLTQPGMSDATAESYAKVVQEEAKNRNFDPFTLVAICRNESHWRAGVISPDKEDLGLCGIRARYIGGCRNDPDPVNNPTESCKRTRAALLNGVYNLRIAAAQITNWRKTCRKITSRPALFKRWLHGYGGMGNLKKGILCNQRKTKKGWVTLGKGKPRSKQRRNHQRLMRIINYRLTLISKLKHRRKRHK